MSGSERTVDAVIVGAGFAGLYQLYRFRELGLTARVFEAAPDVGGTWYWNRYPGARCDVESMSYSYSFSPELEQEWTWTEKYPPQPEILRYLNHVADRFELREDITFSTKVTGATWDDGAKRWTVTTDGGETVTARYVVMATGSLSVPKDPEVPGIERFQGKIYRTADWPHEGVDFTGLRLGVIGTGSSGIQVIPLVAGQAADTTVFQRTPNFTLPAGNRLLTDAEIAERKANYREWREAQRRSGFGVPVPVAEKSAFEVSEEERNATYQAAWDQGSLMPILTAFTDSITAQAANDTAAEFVRGKIREIVENPEVAEKLCPTTYPIGIKRPCLDTDYYATFNKDNVHLVDLRQTPLAEFTDRGIRTAEREYEFDAIILATGFDAITGALTAIDIRGRDGVRLTDKWSDGPRSYLGLAVAGFPNLFTITGPLSPSVLSNMVVSIEQHVDFVTQAVTHLRDNGYAALDANVQAEGAWVAHVDEVAHYTLYPTADTYYNGANVPGKPRVFLAYAGGVGTYREHCEQVAAKGYEGFDFIPA
ncbi:flavin-containing monooxygenase [Actinomadura rugatobispora]|uniref:Flavin-containing monooxygenase n=1 Tax=Actinomadura rugatobispora TaxID=1994 RepID=A0ABW1ABC1_9ACTN|nr:NAD(P)/FAD-dependent oxidoreductase [Actinomadura rugatobispora]